MPNLRPSQIRVRLFQLPVMALLTSAGIWGQDIQVSINGPIPTITAGLQAAKPGDTILVAGGVYRETLRPSMGGSPGAPITIKPRSATERVVVSALEPVAGTPNNEPPVPAGQVVSYLLRQAVTNLPTLAGLPWDPTYGHDAAQVFAGSDALPDSLQMLPEARLPHCPDPMWPERYRLVTSQAVTCQGDGTWTFRVASETPIPDGERSDWGQALVTLLVAGRVGQTFELLRSQGNVLTVRGQGTLPTDLVNVTALTNLDGNLVQIHRTRKALANSGEWLVERDAQGQDRLILRPVADRLLIKARPWTVDFADTKHIVLDGLDLVGGGVRSGSASSDLVLRNCRLSYVSHYTVTSAALGGYSVENASAHPAGDGAIGCLLAGTGHRIEGCTIAYSAGHGVLLQGSGHRIEGNRIHDVGYGLNDGAGIGCIQDEDGRPARDLLLRGNLVYRGARSLIRLSSSAASVIDHNELWHGSMAGRDTGAIYTWGTNDLLAGRDATWIAANPGKSFWNTISNNLIHDPARIDVQNVGYFHTQGIYLDVASEHQRIVGNVIVYANADVRRSATLASATLAAEFPSISNQLSYGIEALGGAHDHLIADNRILTTASGAINVTAGSRWNEIRNNLLTQPVDVDQRWDVGVFTGNTYGGFADRYSVQAPLVETRPLPIALGIPAGNTLRNDWAALLNNFPGDSFGLQIGSGDQSVGNPLLVLNDGTPIIHAAKVNAVNNKLFLYAAATANPGRQLLHYTWECVSKTDPTATVAFDPINGSVLAARLPVVVDKLGTYTFRLTVSNSTGTTVWGDTVAAVVRNLAVPLTSPAIGIQVVGGSLFAQPAQVEKTGDGKFLIQVDRLSADSGPNGDGKTIGVEAIGFQPATVPVANRAYAWTVNNATRLVSGSTGTRVNLDHLVIGDTVLTLACTDTRNTSVRNITVVIRTVDWTSQFSVRPPQATGSLNGALVGNQVGFDQVAQSLVTVDQPAVDLSEATVLPSFLQGVLTRSWSHVSGPLVTFSSATGANTRATVSAFSPDWTTPSVVRVRTTWTRSDGLTTHQDRDIAIMYLDRTTRVSLTVGAAGTFEGSQRVAVGGAIQVTTPALTISTVGALRLPMAGNLIFEVKEAAVILGRGDATSWPVTLAGLGLHTLTVNLYDPLVSLVTPVRSAALNVTVLDPIHQFSITGLAVTPSGLAVRTAGNLGTVTTPMPNVTLAATTRDAYASSSAKGFTWRVTGPPRPLGITPFVANSTVPVPSLALTDPGIYKVELTILAGQTTCSSSFQVVLQDQLALVAPTPPLVLGAPDFARSDQVTIALTIPRTGFTVNGNQNLVSADWFVGTSIDITHHALNFPAVLSTCGTTTTFAPTLIGAAGSRLAYPRTSVRADFTQVAIGLSGTIDALNGTTVIPTTISDLAVYPQYKIAKAKKGAITLSVPTLNAQVSVSANGAVIGTKALLPGEFSYAWTWNAVNAATGAPVVTQGAYSATTSATPTFTFASPGLVYYLTCTISTPLGMVGRKTLRLRVDSIQGNPG